MRNQDDDKDNNIVPIFKGLGRLINIVADMIENDKNEIDIKGDINDPEESKKIVGKYGFNIKLGGEKINKLGDINKLNTISDNSNKERAVPKTIEPVTDIFEEDNKVIVVMELPGVDEENIELEIDENILKIRAEGNGSCYSKDIELKFNPKMEFIKSKLNNLIYSIVINNDN